MPILPGRGPSPETAATARRVVQPRNVTGAFIELSAKQTFTGATAWATGITGTVTAPLDHPGG